MPTSHDGHEHKVRRASVITLNTPMIADLSDDALRTLVGTIVSFVGSGASEDEMTDTLGRAFEDAGAAQSRPVVARMVENLRNAVDVTVVTDDGRVLHGDPSFNPATSNPDVDETEDPQHPDRPVWS